MGEGLGEGKGKRFSDMDYDMKRLIYIEFAVLVSLLLVFAVAAYQRNFVWEDDFSLWSDVVKKSTGKVMPHDYMGIALARN